MRSCCYLLILGWIASSQAFRQRCHAPYRMQMKQSRENGGAQSRRDLLLAGGSFVGPAMLSGFTPSPALASSSRKSAKEEQFEMFKKALDLTHAFRFEEAEAVYSEIIGLFGNPSQLGERDKQLVARAFSNRGNVRSMLDRTSEALVDYSRAIDLSPDQSEYWLNRGLAYEGVGDTLLPNGREKDAFQFYEAAVLDYEHAIVLNPEDHRLYINAGDVLTHLQRHDAALEAYRRALNIFGSPAIRGKVAMSEVQVGNVARGCYLVDSIVKRNTDYAEMLLAESALNWTFGRFAEGLDSYSAAIERDPRLLDDVYLKMALHWPPTMMGMVDQLRKAGAMDGYRATAVSWFDYGISI